ncbi:hypothetical protein NNJEOMEG_02722 [Fundidesulfovibrio magnetotacticus]|uniref:DUF3124 domain-containing protein n=1 Tax=Fundidesulfovibrio magnetotacticus TaxID=2730080 RepID=A0A6V8LT26_9BACT|nr:DUF3124 domain-containing protein [Fundidesulfovibrio magnetotacticus]GFK94874.1 hypothetical protein NNJEOMEG_02722 [Fundidesulfovibrio magnetotacticus]
MAPRSGFAPRAALAALVLALALLAAPALAGGPSKGQTLYVPCYSHIYHGIKTRPIDLTITLSARNTDPARPVRLLEVDYYDTAGKLVKRHLEKPMVLEPLATAEFIVGQTDVTGGSGANFLVRWSAEEPVSPLLVEAVMIGTSAQQGISFTSRGLPVAGR